jgi:exodeoxyribonuclease VII large subunit
LLEALNPEAILRRGYAIVRQKDGRLVRTARAVAGGAIVDVQLSDGRFAAEVTEVDKEQKAHD